MPNTAVPGAVSFPSELSLPLKPPQMSCMDDLMELEASERSVDAPVRCCLVSVALACRCGGGLHVCRKQMEEVALQALRN